MDIEERIRWGLLDIVVALIGTTWVCSLVLIVMVSYVGHRVNELHEKLDDAKTIQIVELVEVDPNEM